MIATTPIAMAAASIPGNTIPTKAATPARRLGLRAWASGSGVRTWPRGPTPRPYWPRSVRGRHRGRWGACRDDGVRDRPPRGPLRSAGLLVAIQLVGGLYVPAQRPLDETSQRGVTAQLIVISGSPRWR